MKKCILIVMFVLCSTVALAVAPTLESLKAELDTKIKQMETLKNTLAQLEQNKAQTIQSGLILQGEIAQIEKLVKDFDILPKGKK